MNNMKRFDPCGEVELKYSSEEKNVIASYYPLFKIIMKEYDFGSYVKYHDAKHEIDKRDFEIINLKEEVERLRKIMKLGEAFNECNKA